MIGAIFWENGFNLKEIGVATMVLFAVIDIFGTIPVIIALKEKTGKIFPLRTATVALFILVGFLFVGESITGNDCVEQALQFNEVTNLDGVILSKADIDEMGGATLSISYTLQKPIYFLGVGQNYTDLIPFKKDYIMDKLGL